MAKAEQSNNWSYIKYKKLEELWAWATFYNVNRHEKKLTQIQIHIEELRKELFEPVK